MIWAVVANVSGFAIWLSVAAFTWTQWRHKFQHPDGGVRIMAGRSALALTVGLLVTCIANFNVSRLHLLWFAPLAFFGSNALTLALMRRNMAISWDRMKSESERTGVPLVEILQRETGKLAKR